MVCMLEYAATVVLLCYAALLLSLGLELAAGAWVEHGDKET